MTRSLHDLIGDIIHPRPRTAARPDTELFAMPVVPLPVLIGRVIGPPAGPVPAQTSSTEAHPRQEPEAPSIRS